jgi:hypothetical protein
MQVFAPVELCKCMFVLMDSSNSISSAWFGSSICTECKIGEVWVMIALFMWAFVLGPALWKVKLEDFSIGGDGGVAWRRAMWMEKKVKVFLKGAKVFQKFLVWVAIASPSLNKDKRK